jgi:hypothetical protein
MMLLWRDSWLKPLTDGDVGRENCTLCKKKFKEIDFVTGCDFCDIGIMHDSCANKHILRKHYKELDRKISSHKDKPLHDYQ